MLALEPVIVARLRQALASEWTVFGFTADKGNRDAYPLASVRFLDGSLADSKTSSVAVQPVWRVTLVSRRSDDAATLVDAAFAQCIASLHNWMPGQAGGRGWNRMALVRFSEPQYLDSGLVGVELLFATTAQFKGQN